ncbi:MAG: hypothetical protein JWQ98_3342 [Chlorobi bacterium]|nr:hypothetical protein [Chlorobiota bacterium]
MFLPRRKRSDPLIMRATIIFVIDGAYYRIRLLGERMNRSVSSVIPYASLIGIGERSWIRNFISISVAGCERQALMFRISDIKNNRAAGRQ